MGNQGQKISQKTRNRRWLPKKVSTGQFLWERQKKNFVGKKKPKGPEARPTKGEGKHWPTQDRKVHSKGGGKGVVPCLLGLAQ